APPVVTTEDPAAVALRKRQEAERKERERQEADQREQQRREQARQEQAKREREAKEAAERARRAEADRLKGEVGGLFGSGGGKGNTGTNGNQGDPNGDPNAGALEGVSTGSGKVGGGLGGRGVESAPRLNERFTKQGTVVLNVCVGADGRVVSAEQTLRGSSGQTTPDMVSSAISNAKAWRFSAGDVDKQCGTITYNFKLQ
ncbi:MAG: hypothetical protein WBA17_01780, partial [Saprospiraceae bacterium]